MSIDDAELRLQAIVRVSVRDPRGNNAKVRPVLVIAFDDEHEGVFWYCAISTRFSNPLEPYCIRLPHLARPGGHPATGLDTPCVAVCTWVDKASSADVVDKRGYLPTKRFALVCECIQRHIDADPTQSDSPPTQPDAH